MTVETAAVLVAFCGFLSSLGWLIDVKLTDAQGTNATWVLLGKKQSER